MASVHLLILGMNYAPEVTGIAPYTAGLAQHLAEKGHRVTVATTFPHYPAGKVQGPFHGALAGGGPPNRREVRRPPGHPPRRREGGRPRRYQWPAAGGPVGQSADPPPRRGGPCVTPPIQLGLTGALL